MSDTPRTDAQYKEYSRRDNNVKCVDIDFARTLERELNEAKQRETDQAVIVALIKGEIAKSHAQSNLLDEQAVQLRAEVERLKLASFSQFSKIEELKIACDQWRAVAEQLGEGLRKTILWAESASMHMDKDAHPDGINWKYLNEGRKALAAYEKLKSQS